MIPKLFESEPRIVINSCCSFVMYIIIQPLLAGAAMRMNQLFYYTTATALTTRLPHICKILITLDKEWPYEKLSFVIQHITLFLYGARKIIVPPFQYPKIPTQRKSREIVLPNFTSKYPYISVYFSLRIHICRCSFDQ